MNCVIIELVHVETRVDIHVDIHELNFPVNCVIIELVDVETLFM